MLLALAAGLAAACEGAEPAAGVAPAALQPPPAAPSAPKRVRIPEGSFEAGTEPGRFEREPRLEPRTARIALGAFEIDTTPFAGPSGAPLEVATRERALTLCREGGGRLCTELEWERACKGPRSDPFAGGEAFDAACSAEAGGCVSGFGVRGMGSLREWTASDADDGGGLAAVLRGAGADEPPAHHRCAHRSLVREARPNGIGFRCCYGPPNAARVESPELGPTFTQVNLPLPALGELLSSDPKTRDLAGDLSYFAETDASRVLERGTGDTQGFLLTTAPLRWNPVLGAEFLIVTARSGKATSFVLAYHVLGEERYRLASSFIMQGEPGPVVLAYNGYIRPRLHFSTCWGCPGETGKVLYRDPDQALILQP